MGCGGSKDETASPNDVVLAAAPAARPRAGSNASEPRSSMVGGIFKSTGRRPSQEEEEGVEYDMGRFSITCDKVQSDPFAPPSRFRVSVPLAVADFPPHCFASRTRQVAFRDFLTRRFAAGTMMAASSRALLPDPVTDTEKD